MSTPAVTYRDFLAQLSDAVALPLPQVSAGLLDGDAGRALHGTISIERRKRLGAFFTPQVLAERATSAFRKIPSNVYDPACGAGDLLLPIARRLPQASTADETLRLWGTVLGGCDVVPEFVEAARLRLALLASVLTDDRADLRRLPTLLPNFTVANGKELLRQRRGGSLVLNPPFGIATAPRGHAWMRGRVAKAAVFVDLAITALDADDTFAAILPDVIRSGTRYEPLRRWLVSNLKAMKIDVYGRFGDTADVDVFVLSGRKRTRPLDGDVAFDWGTESRGRQLESAFRISVGQIVEYRDKSEDAPRAFLASRYMKPWTEQRRLPAKWGAGARAVTPPFVAIARTSSPGDRYRARAALITGRRPVAVENHLIIAAPRTGKIAEARQLMRWLKSARVNRFLQVRIRCRHLTVRAVGEIPLPDSKKRRK